MALLTSAAPSLAACPIELSTYADRDGAAEINFVPNREAVAVSNSFRMMVDKDVVLYGIVMWSDGVRRPNAMLMYMCPDGDVTAEEYEACTVWQGVVYTADETGKIDLLPAQGTPAPRTLIFPDLAHALAAACFLLGLNLNF